MAHARQDEEVEPLVRLDQRVRQPKRVRRVDVVVDVARRQHQVALQVLGQLGILLDVELELDLTVFAVHFPDAVMLLAPGVVVDVVLVIA